MAKKDQKKTEEKESDNGAPATLTQHQTRKRIEEILEKRDFDKEFDW